MLRPLALPLLCLLLVACGDTPSTVDSGAEPVALSDSPRANTELAIYRDVTQPIDDRIADLIGRMTTEEKVAQITAVWADKHKMEGEDYSFDPTKARDVIPYGIGHVTRPSERAGNGESGRSGAEEVAYVNAIQRYLVEDTRLGIPALMHEESLHGLAAKDATSWGQPIAVAATFNRQLTRRLYSVAGRQAASRGAHVVLTPVVDVARDPRWGRVEETLGEDPYLAAQIGLQAVLGFQGDNDRWDEGEVYATLKHMAGHGEPEGGNNIGPASVSERTLREVFLFPFRYIVENSNVRNIMASYNEVNGVPSHANGWMLNDILRGEWGYRGAVVSDYFAVKELHTRHAVAASLREAAIRAIRSGVDIELPDREAFPHLVDAVNSGELSESILDTAVGRILRQKFERGLFENPYTDPDKVLSNTPEDDALVREAGTESMILLKNEGLLPLRGDLTIGLVGPNADKVLLGGYSDEPQHFVTVREGLEQYVAANGGRVIYSEGTRVTKPGSWYRDSITPVSPADDRKRIAKAVSDLAAADIIVLAVGGNELTSREAWAESHQGDRPSLELLGTQNELIDALAELGKPIVGLVFGGRPLDIRNLLDKSDAVFQCFYLGQETGHSVADVLYGSANPSGKLPISLPRSVGHIPAFYNYKPSARRGYLFDNVNALFPFGYGLSYTTFTYSEPQLGVAQMSTTGNTKVTVEVTNSGERGGYEVIQLYVRDEYSTVTRPVKELRGFQKIYLNPGETVAVTFEIGFEQLNYLNEAMAYVVEPGTFLIMVGSSSRDEDLKSAILTITGQAK
ncbi:glycoside hydrolase family 3 N-terminal domain-containing protein [Lewinella sp. JB7]|uniref:glycoside hydrolase family 3 N-terminal domain-containing protein n=1 Tax=Lewinella sp. JB7 TaxID=2962887 RepID=UPI0020C9E40C|nr:glycoside hydrolase family 3 N-terminal domain-containing protein [Lewinella sp. JB7]MCP9237235.1 glycoside hydrolase family 3 C-terminal domain-containing protein [Lewinella sp. JB7]